MRAARGIASEYSLSYDQLAPTQRLKLLARARKLSRDDDDDDDDGDDDELLPASAPISLNTSAKMLEEPEELPRSVSEPADLALAARDRHLPNWFRSLSTSQKSEERARQQRFRDEASAVLRSSFAE